jgi:galactose mutarotase-like enzyme
MVQLSNEKLKICISKAGAEMHSLIFIPESCELLWQGESNVWPRRAPVLFPIVGKLANEGYAYKGEFYKLTQHGFARDCEFELHEISATKAVFSLSANEHTLKLFPFLFELTITYTLLASTLQIDYTIFNRDKNTLPFSIGAHPGFKLPFFENEKVEDYFLKFPKANYHITTLDKGLRTSQQQLLRLQDARLALNNQLFEKDALVFENNQLHSVEIGSVNHTLSLSLIAENCPYFGIWSKSGTLQFVCLEPWWGIADKVGDDDDLFSKDGILRLNPGETKLMSHRIIVNNA